MVNKKSRSCDASLSWIVTNRCNLNCSYCFFNPFKKIEKLTKIDTSALIKTLEKTNKTFRIRITGGGEPFLIPNLIEVCETLIKKHYIIILTNLTLTNRIKEFVQTIKPKNVIIQASLHIKELERCNLLNDYINNFLLCKKKGFIIDAVAVAYPPLINEVQKYKEFFRGKGIIIQFKPFIGKYQNKKYPESYTEKEMKAFGFSREGFRRAFNHKHKLCNAGYNTAIVRSSGRIHPCTQICENLGNIYKKIRFKRNLTICPFKFCCCPQNVFEQYLLRKALKGNKPGAKKPKFIYVLEYKLRDKIKTFFK